MQSNTNIVAIINIGSPMTKDIMLPYATPSAKLNSQKTFDNSE